MFNKKTKKGFTIVELVIVIAVIAILSAVLIPTFAGLIKKANISADQTLVRNLNTSLAISSEGGGTKNSTMYQTLEAMKEQGYSVEKLTPTSTGSEIVWDSEKNQFVLIMKDKNGNAEYYTGTAYTEYNTNEYYKLWKIFTRVEDVNGNTTYSAYLAGKEQGGAVSVNGVGFDAGENVGISTVTYKNETNVAKDVVIRTAGQMSTLIIEGKGGDDGDTVNHYGFANVVNVNSVGNVECYHEYGTTNTLTAKAGKVVVESVGSVFELKKALDAVTDANAPTFKNNNGNVLKAEAGTLADTEQVTNVYNINNYEQLCSFRDATNSGMTFAGITVNLNCDIDLQDAWVPISNYSRATSNVEYMFAGTFDGHNHTISGLTNIGISAEVINTGHNDTTPKDGTEYVYGFFASVNNATIKNLNLTKVNIEKINSNSLLGDCNAACVGFINATNTDQNKVNIENIHVYGNVSGYDNVAGVVGMARNATDKGNKDNHYFTIKGCTFEGVLYAVRRSAGIVAQLSSDIYEARLESCTAKGTASSHYSQDHDTSSQLSYYLCGGLATWGQTKRLNVVSCSSEMTTSAESVSDTVTGNLYNDFIIVEKTSSMTNNTLDYTPYKVDSNGHYYKNNNHVPTVIE